MARRTFWGDSDSKLAFILFCFTVVLGSLLSPPDCQRSSWQTRLFIASPRQPGLLCLSRLKEVLMFKKTPQTLNKHLPEIKILSMNFYRCIFPPVSSCMHIRHQYLNFILTSRPCWGKKERKAYPPARRHSCEPPQRMLSSPSMCREILRDSCSYSLWD